MDELRIERSNGTRVVLEYTGHCKNFGQEVPAGVFLGCCECPVAQLCWEVWELSERSQNVRLELRAGESGARRGD